MYFLILVGAGFGFSAGRLTEVYDDYGEIISNNFQNTIGIHFGALFSAESGEEARNIFAPIVNFSVLDFQIGLGYELGTISENQKRTFVTLSYAIPLYKLTNTGFWIWLSDKEVGDDPKFSKTF